MRRATIIAIFAMLMLPAVGQAKAQSLRVSPVTIDVPMSERSSTINISNDSPKSVTVQARVFRWSQKNGQDVLDKTADVAISPPVVTVKSNATTVVRLVRVASAPVAGEETYRVFLDEVADRARLQMGGVAITIRQSIPVFFSSIDLRPGVLNWTSTVSEDKLIVTANNAGQKRIRITEISLINTKLGELAKIEGLAGYVLGGQAKIWEFPVKRGSLTPGVTINIEATTDAGPVNASSVIRKSG